MGKTKTAFVGGTDDQPVKKGYDKAAKEAKRKERASNAVSSMEKVYVPNLQNEAASDAVPSEPSTASDPSVPKAKDKKIRSKKYRESYSKISKDRLYKLPEAITLVKEASYSSFDGTMELHMTIKKEGFSTNVTLPHSFGKQKRIVVADETVVEQLKAGKIEFDVLLSTADMMPKLVPFARLLGPRGLMPNPKNGTLIKNAKEADNFSTAATTLKTEKKAPVIHTAVGKVSQSNEDLTQNIETIFSAIGTRQILRVYLKSTMSPSVKVQVV